MVQVLLHSERQVGGVFASSSMIVSLTIYAGTDEYKKGVGETRALEGFSDYYQSDKSAGKRRAETRTEHLCSLQISTTEVQQLKNVL